MHILTFGSQIYLTIEIVRMAINSALIVNLELSIHQKIVYFQTWTNQIYPTLLKLELAIADYLQNRGDTKKSCRKSNLSTVFLDIEDELHFSIVCAKLDSPRQKLFEKIISVVPSFSDLSETEKFNFIFSSNDYDINGSLSKYTHFFLFIFW